MPIPSLPTPQIQEAERKVSAILDELEQTTDVDVKDIDLEAVVDTDPASGRPAVHQAVEITVQPRPRRKWLK